MDSHILEQIAEIEDFKLLNSIVLSGGSINAVYQLETSTGKMVIKINSAEKYARMFQKEAEGLKLLKTVDAFKIPEVYAVREVNDQAYLLMEYLPTRRNREGTWKDFAINLAKLHNHSAKTFGLEYDNYIGSLPQFNKTDLTNAGEFYIEKRLKPQFERAKQVGFSFGNLNQFYEHIKYHIPDEKPALVHGDLWNENYLLTQEGRPALIDPAVAYAPREMDLGMMKLFRGFPDKAFSIYQDIFPMESGWEDRIEIWQLYYLLAHLNLFGQNYFHPISRIMARFK